MATTPLTQSREPAGATPVVLPLLRSVCDRLVLARLTDRLVDDARRTFVLVVAAAVGQPSAPVPTRFGQSSALSRAPSPSPSSFQFCTRANSSAVRPVKASAGWASRNSAASCAARSSARIDTKRR